MQDFISASHSLSWSHGSQVNAERLTRFRRSPTTSATIAAGAWAKSISTVPCPQINSNLAVTPKPCHDMWHSKLQEAESMNFIQPNCDRFRRLAQQNSSPNVYL
eukprot:4986172-Pleurochrysis_carterae.AAC.2